MVDLFLCGLTMLVIGFAAGHYHGTLRANLRQARDASAADPLSPYRD